MATKVNSGLINQTVDLIRQGLEVLRLGQMRGVFDESLAQPVSDQSRVAWLWQLLEPEIQLRTEARIERRIKEARLPTRKTFESFDFSFQPKLDQQLVLELGTLRFMERGANILLAGMSGTGKSHIALALGLQACAANRRVLYTTSEKMLTRLSSSVVDDTLQKTLQPYIRTELLILDEIGLEQAERKQAARAGLMQKVLFPRYEQSRSTIITSNIPWEAWGNYLEDDLGAAAILDRLVHRSHIIVIDGPSYRQHQHRQELQAQVGQ